MVADKNMKLAIFDLDGTLFDTKNVNFLSYKNALSQFGYELNYDYFCSNCNGKHYLEFLPEIMGDKEELYLKIHNLKKMQYSFFLKEAKKNDHLFAILDSLKSQKDYYICLATTASKKNTIDILNYFYVLHLFDLVLTREDYDKGKPDPEVFLQAMSYFEISESNTIIFEDSEVGLNAAKNSGANYYKVFGFN